MFVVNPDLPRNRLYLVLAGSISAEEADRCAALIISRTLQLKPGFTVINDISLYTVATNFFSARSSLQRVMDHFAVKKAKRVVRVVGASKSGMMEFARATLGLGKKYPYGVVYVPTLEAAEAKLDELEAAEASATAAATG